MRPILSPCDLGLPEKFGSFRSYRGFDQLSIAADIADGFDRRRFQMCNAATGVGKSLLFMTAAALRGDRVLALVGTKALQTQHLGDFASVGMRDVRGHCNYPCMPKGPRTPKPGSDRDSGPYDPAMDDHEAECEVPPLKCGWKRDVYYAFGARSVVSNYSFWLSIGRYADPGLLGDFDLLVLDEAHVASHFLAEFVSVKLDADRLRRMLDIGLPNIAVGDLPAWADWARTALDLVRRKLEILKAAGRQGTAMRRLRLLSQDLGELITSPKSPIEWVGETTEYGVKFSPLWGSLAAEKYLFRGIPRVLLCSATLSRETGGYLGVPPAEMEYREIPSPFPVANRPVIYTPICRVDKNMSEGDFGLLARRFDKAAEARLELGRRGIVHSRSYKWAYRLAEKSSLRDHLIAHRGSSGKGDRSLPTLREALERYWAAADTDPLVIISPAVEEGFDFAGDLARWQWVLKAMVVDSRDPLTAARIKADKRYRYIVAGEALQQIFGRIVRSANDWGETLIGDEHFGYVRNEAPFPGYVRAAFKYEKVLPAPMKEPVPTIGKRG